MSNKSEFQNTLKTGTEVQLDPSLRAAAEQRLANQARAHTIDRPAEEIIHELQVYQTALEMQNEELRRMQLLMEETRDRYVDFYDIAPVGYLTLDSDATIDEINLTGATLLGEARSDLLHRRFAGFIAPEDRDIWHQNFTGVLQHDDTSTCELGILRADKTRRHVRLDSLRLLKGNKTPVVRIVLTDVSESKRSEAALREQKEFYRTITENIDDFIAVLDLDGRRLYNGPSYARLFGNPETMKGTDSFAEIHPDDREHVRDVFMETVKTGIGMRIEYRFVLPKGEIRFMESCGALIRNSQGQALRVVVVSRDITERIMAEDHIRNMAFYDVLTKLPNRRMFDDRLSQAMVASKRTGRYNALMFLDMDNFKPLNDQYGHSAGDLLLKEVSHRIVSCVREMDTVSRFGGDEFVVMLTELDTDKNSSVAQAGIVADKIRAVLAKPYKLVLQHEGEPEMVIEYICTSSIGVVMFIDHELMPGELLKRADKVMYQAKESGRNQVRFFKI
jgi:diguanylate cyclase (GGDEF)-like protein/PAS domain S-box-containing protein